MNDQISESTRRYIKVISEENANYLTDLQFFEELTKRYPQQKIPGFTYEAFMYSDKRKQWVQELIGYLPNTESAEDITDNYDCLTELIANNKGLALLYSTTHCNKSISEAWGEIYGLK